jgi:hypothetical protein
LNLELIRAWLPEDLGDDDCLICKQPFERESVLLMGDEGKSACPTCIEYLGRRNPDLYPTLAEYEEAKRRFPEPIWASEADIADLDPYWSFTNEVSIIEREP